MINADKIANKRNPGYCFECAGFERVGYTKVRGLLVMRLAPNRFPAPHKVGQQRLFG